MKFTKNAKNTQKIGFLNYNLGNKIDGFRNRATTLLTMRLKIEIYKKNTKKPKIWVLKCQFR
jgi:hypothetical protein